MQSIKAAVAVFCTACICAELTAQLTGQGWARRSIKAVAGLYILAVVLRVLPQAKAEWKAFSVPAAASVELGTQEEAVLRQTASQLEETLETRCREELGTEVSIHIELEETADGVRVRSLTLTPTTEAGEKRDAVEELLQNTLGVSPVWNTSGGENTP